jgi:UDP:flavonoid glycosyltransferase YjiC (YdhE family)
MEFDIPSHVTRQGMESQLAYLRSAYGLPPYPAMEMLTRYLYFSYVPNSYQFPEYTLPENTHVLRPAFLDPSGDEVLPDWVAALPDQPTVYASMGTTFNNVPDIFRTIIAGLADEPVNLIITVGRSQDPRQFDPLPEHVYVEQFIPQAALMPYCDLVMANGGVGTLMIALTYGLPLIVIPLAGHLLLHAQRVRQLGIGQSLKLPPAWLDVGDAADVDNYVARQASGLVRDTAPELSPETVRSVVGEVLEAASYKEEVERLQQEIVNMPGPASAVPLLEQLGTRSEG